MSARYRRSTRAVSEAGAEIVKETSGHRADRFLVRGHRSFHTFLQLRCGQRRLDDRAGRHRGRRQAPKMNLRRRGTVPAKGKAPMKTNYAKEKVADLDARFELFLTLFVRTTAPRQTRLSRRR
jgi:hypothetical protein